MRFRSEEGDVEKGMEQIKTNHLEIMARAWAGDKGREIAGTVVDLALTHSGATLPRLEDIAEAERFMERFLTAWLKHSTVEFVHVYERALEERCDQLERMLNEHVNTTPTAPFFIKKP